MRLRQFVLLIVAIACASVVLAQPKPAAPTQWAPGKYTVVSRGHNSTKGMAEGQVISDTEDRYELTVRKPDAAGQKVQLVFTRLTMQAKAGVAGAFQYDTDKPAGDDPSSLQARFKARTGAPMEASIDPNGKVVAVTGVEEVVRRMGLADDPVKAQPSADICKAAVTMSIERLILRIPAEPLVKDYAWTRNESIKIGPQGQIDMSHEYKVKSVEDTPDGKVAEIDVVSKNTTDKPVPTDENSAKWAKIVPIEVAARETTGALRLNLSTGMIVYSKMHSKASMKGVSLMDGGNLPFSTDSESDSEFTVTPANAAPAK